MIKVNSTSLSKILFSGATGNGDALRTARAIEFLKELSFLVSFILQLLSSAQGISITSST
jgi:hypothetical protein